MDFLRSIFIAAACIALAVVAVSRLATRRSGRLAGFRWPSQDPAQRMELLQRLVLTPHHSLHLIRISGKDVLIAAHTHGVTLVTPGEGIGREVDS